ncbi:MAG TPA: hypothetical protein VHV31_13665 [Nitrolancea sp.]|jgi:hypothetical protein|nr:hypothetical protein [Nitrolancea sp.]
MARFFDWLFRRQLELPVPVTDRAIELPWTQHWYHIPKRTAGWDFREEDYQAARINARIVAKDTLGADAWNQVRRTGYIDVPSRRFPGLSYRLRVGRRIEVRTRPGVDSPWPFPYLCINPVYPLPEEEFFAHLYLYARDFEDEIIRVGAPQPWDQRLGRTF